ncbi:response regulator [Paraburkholderia edwinii]|uniref:histidine kinase n=1 Tax=Paraburkholderia edwinii TaxID=2861782 RepID=A0ABX8UV29_9BURK|nr:response regulator [Paraburkholderia edwinii]QYD72511.1 response regulator [Paraburkholderia edwinii]
MPTSLEQADGKPGKTAAVATVDQANFRRIIRRNIALPLAVGLVTIAVFAVLIAYLVSTVNWVEHSERVIGDANEALRLAVDRESSLRGFLLTGDDAFLAPYQAGQPRFQSQIAELTGLVADNPPQIEKLKTIQTIQARWNAYAQQMIDLKRKHQDVTDIVAAGRGKAEFDETRRIFGDFLELEQDLRHQRSDAARSLTGTTVAVFLVFSVLISALLAFRGRRDLLNLSGNYDAVLQQQVAHTEQLQQQVWLRSGQRLLAEKVVGQATAPLVGRAILEFLAQYLDVIVAALYVRDRINGELRRVATYGFSAESEQNTRNFHDGEGLVGQAASSRRTIVLHQVPDNYIKVVSATGAGAPTSVIVQPIENDGAVNGIVEMGFMRPAGARDQEFLQLVSTSIGDFIEAALYRERLQDALAETQQLNEELQVQQEELRVSNEGLEERGRALVESQTRLEAQQAELEQTNVQLEEYAQRLERQKAELLSAQDELAANAARLEQSSRYKSEFLANMSHELRTPLNSSLILARLLQENRTGNLSDEQVRYAETIHASNSDLLVLINDILDLSKVEAGQITIEPVSISIDALLRSLREMFEPMAAAKHLQFSAQRAPGVPDTIVTDGQRLTQILRNLLSNALKFTERGEVALDIAAEAGMLRVDVRDTGIGIAEDKLEMIFDAFQQADGSTSRHYGGSGLGLSISREFARLLGGRIGVVSDLGRGSVFTLWLPTEFSAEAVATMAQVAPTPAGNLRGVSSATSGISGTSGMSGASSTPVTSGDAGAAAALARAAAPAGTGSGTAPYLSDPSTAGKLPATRGLGGLRSDTTRQPIDDDRHNRKHVQRLILAIEDDLAFAEILRDLAHELEFDFIHATDAASGVAMVRDLQPTAVLLDVGLPDRSGLTVLEWLKNDPATRHIPIHIVSATDHAEKALHLGAVGYTLKPTARTTLEAAIRRLETRLQQHMKRVLVIEDDRAMRESIRALLQSASTEIVAVATLGEALEELGRTQFDCVVTDLALPDGTGYDLLERMAADTALQTLPVIVYTGRMLSGDEEHRLRRYSKSIIIKGAKSPERLLDEVTLFLHSVESSLAPEQQRMLRTVRQRDNAFEGRTILLAEDDVRNIFALSHVIEPLGARLEIARNGREALDLLEQGVDVDLVLMDIMMPEMDGLTATAQIRANPRFSQLPIIALTAKAMAHDRMRCLEAGADDYISKPIDVDKLISLCRVWLRQR